VPLMDILQFIAGLVLLVFGAWVLVSGGSRVAAMLGIPPVVVGLTVVAFGTSAPELFVSILGAVNGSTGLVLGSVVGSNVANLGLILAVAAIIRPVLIERGLTRNEVPYMFLATIAFVVMVWDGKLSRVDSGILVAGFFVFIAWTIRNTDRGGDPESADRGPDIAVAGGRGRAMAVGIGLIILGVACLGGGGHFIVGSAIRFAAGFGVSETLIGLTMVAIGTSLPELATTIVAAMRDEDDLALGNIIGSNIFNLLAVAGPVGLIWGLNVEGDQNPLAHFPLPLNANQIQLLSMTFLTLMVTTMILFGRGKVGRIRGLSLLAVYILIMMVWST
jgi:cation:H+ antiporter